MLWNCQRKPEGLAYPSVDNHGSYRDSGGNERPRNTRRLQAPAALLSLRKQQGDQKPTNISDALQDALEMKFDDDLREIGDKQKKEEEFTINTNTASEQQASTSFKELQRRPERDSCSKFM